MAVELTSIDNPRSFYEAGREQGYCALCGHLARPQVVSTWEVHHVLAKQHCRFGVPRHSPDNALRLCAKSPASCHSRHTSHQHLLPLECLREENIAFVVRWLGEGPAFVYLQRSYSGSDARVNALLEFV